MPRELLAIGYTPEIPEAHAKDYGVVITSRKGEDHDVKNES